ncbi:MAG: hypothetical protein H6R10_2947 [Rhodocyclaceae bacterium]|nr:hypothetical protein [Rhodocyclaceae bacterium]
MAIGSVLRGNDPGCYEFVSPEELFTHFSEIQAKGLMGSTDDLQTELKLAAGSNSR